MQVGGIVAILSLIRQSHPILSYPTLSDPVQVGGIVVIASLVFVLSGLSGLYIPLYMSYVNGQRL